MTWLAPGYLAAGILAAVGVLVLHLIVTRQPRTVPLPTARFAADVTALARPRALRPSDLLIMLIRMLIVLSAGAALARPVLHPARRSLMRIVLADHTPAALRAAVDDSVRVLAGAGDSVVPFDSGGVSAALIRGLRAAAVLRERADSFELAIVGPLLAGQLDGATDSIRALWPGAVRLVHVAAADSGPPRPARIEWQSRPSGQGRRQAFAATAGGVTIVAPMTRDSVAAPPPPGALVAARWLDGEPAAWEVAAAGGCVRTVRIGLPVRGDLELTPRFARFAARLNGPCGPGLDRTPADSARLLALGGPDGLAAAASITPSEQRRSPWTTRLLLLAGALLLAEWALRNRRPAPDRLPESDR